MLTGKDWVKHWRSPRENVNFSTTFDLCAERRLALHEMTSFKEIRDILLVAYDSGVISAEDFVILFSNFESKNPEFPFKSYDRFDLETMDESECLAEFRVERQDIQSLANAMQIPEYIFCEQRTK